MGNLFAVKSNSLDVKTRYDLSLSLTTLQNLQVFIRPNEHTEYNAKF